LFLPLVLADHVSLAFYAPPHAVSAAAALLAVPLQVLVLFVFALFEHDDAAIAFAGFEMLPPRLHRRLCSKIKKERRNK
jgi:hypothetical protein